MSERINGKELDKLREALNAVETNNRVIISSNGNGLNDLTDADRLELAQFAQKESMIYVTNSD